MKSSAHRLLLAGVVIMHWCTASVAEVCRFVGTTDYAGHITVTTTAATMDGLTKIDVNTSFEFTIMFWFGVHYLVHRLLDSRPICWIPPVTGERVVRGFSDWAGGHGSTSARN